MKNVWRIAFLLLLSGCFDSFNLFTNDASGPPDLVGEASTDASCCDLGDGGDSDALMRFDAQGDMLCEGTDDQCGGTCPLACVDGKSCHQNSDCQSSMCQAGTCQGVIEITKVVSSISCQMRKGLPDYATIGANRIVLKGADSTFTDPVMRHVACELVGGGMPQSSDYSCIVDGVTTAPVFNQKFQLMDCALP